MVVSDAEDVKDTYPDEYRLYERLGIKSVLAIPLEPRQIALIAVRNPQRYTHQTSMLKLLPMCYWRHTTISEWLTV